MRSEDDGGDQGPVGFGTIADHSPRVVLGGRVNSERDDLVAISRGPISDDPTALRSPR